MDLLQSWSRGVIYDGTSSPEKMPIQTHLKYFRVVGMYSDTQTQAGNSIPGLSTFKGILAKK